MFLGRVVEPGEPEWLPDDRDVVDMFLAEERTRNTCGHWPWDKEELAGLEPGYRICPVCAEMEPYAEKVREQNRARSEDQHGLTFGWFPARGEDE